MSNKQPYDSTEERLKYYQDIIALLPGHVYWKNKEGVFLGCNLQQAKDAGFASVDEMIGKTDDDMPWSIQAEYLRGIDKKVMQSQAPLTMEELFELPNGTRKIYLSKKLPLFDENEQVTGILGISFDITEQKKLEEDLIKSKELAEAANNAKTEFLDNMRHDIRTPLTGILGCAEIIKQEVDNPRVKEYVENLEASCSILLEFLNEILEAIKVLSGEIPLVKKRFNLKKIVDKIILLFKPKALQKNLQLNLNYDSTLPEYVIGDPKRIQKILLELISNSLNFTHQGHVNVTIEAYKKQNHEIVLKCIVEDTGIGIPAEKQEEIYLRFKRLIPSYQGIYKGTGLGLAIVKQFVDDMKGEIYCKSQVDKGTTFTFLFTLQEALLDSLEEFEDEMNFEIKVDREFDISDPSIKIKKNVLHQSKILLVEDQDIASVVAKKIITDLDSDVDVAKNGKTALEYFNNNEYDLIFMDVGLPDISGIEITKQIRALEWRQKKHVPIVALTAHVDSENKQKCIEAGMDAVLSKPLSLNTTNDILNAFIPFRKNIMDKNLELYSSKAALLSLQGKIIDEEMGIEKMNGDIDAANKLLTILIQDLKIELPYLIDAKNNDDWKTIESITHKLLGGSVYCGTPRFQQACNYLENYLILGKTEWREELFDQLVREIKNIISR